MPRHWLRWLIADVVTAQDHGLLEFLLVFTRSWARNEPPHSVVAGGR